MLGYLKRLVTTGAAYQFGDILAKGLALLTLPLYTRHLERSLRRRRNAADGGDPVEHLPARRYRRSVHPLLLRRRGHSPARADRPHGDRDGRVDDDARVARGARVRRPALAAAADFRRPAAVRLRGARTVGVHQPRDGLRPAAGRRAQARVRICVGRQRGDDGGVHRAAGRVRRPGRARPAARQLRCVRVRRARPVVGAAPPRVAACAGSPTCARCCVSGCRPSRPTPACTRCRSPTASTCSGSTPSAPPAITRSRSSSRPSCSWRSAAFSTRGRRWRTRSRATRKPRGCTRS